MHKAYFVIIPPGLARTAASYQSGENRFGYLTTKAGQFVCPMGCVSTFPELFDGITITGIYLSADDFPPKPVPAGLPGSQ